MASDEFLARIDEHLARGNELMEEIRREHELNRVTAERTRKAYDDQLQITREVVRRSELAFQENSRTLRELVEAVREVRADLRELGEETRAQTRAIFRVLDRLDGGAEAAGA